MVEWLEPFLHTFPAMKLSLTINDNPTSISLQWSKHSLNLSLKSSLFHFSQLFLSFFVFTTVCNTMNALQERLKCTSSPYLNNITSHPSMWGCLFTPLLTVTVQNNKKHFPVWSDNTYEPVLYWFYLTIPLCSLLVLTEQQPCKVDWAVLSLCLE